MSGSPSNSREIRLAVADDGVADIMLTLGETVIELAVGETDTVGETVAGLAVDEGDGVPKGRGKSVKSIPPASALGMHPNPVLSVPRVVQATTAHCGRVHVLLVEKYTLRHSCSHTTGDTVGTNGEGDNVTPGAAVLVGLGLGEEVGRAIRGIHE